jgi:hypothetical protein
MKLSPLTIILIGASILIMALSYGFFQHYLPNSTEAGYYRTFAEQLEAEGNQLPAAENRLKKAEELVTTKAAEWRAVVATKTPLPDVNARGVNLNVDGWQLTVDTKKFRDNIQRAVNAQIVKGGVKVVGAGPQVPMPTDNAADVLASFYNYPAIAFPVVILDLGTITVTGTEAQIMENHRAWKNMPRYLAVAHNLAISGTSPNLTGTYDVTMVGYIRGKQIFPAVPQGGAPSGGGAGAGAGGGVMPRGAGAGPSIGSAAAPAGR